MFGGALATAGVTFGVTMALSMRASAEVDSDLHHAWLSLTAIDWSEAEVSVSDRVGLDHRAALQSLMASDFAQGLVSAINASLAWRMPTPGFAFTDASQPFATNRLGLMPTSTTYADGVVLAVGAPSAD